MKSVLITPEGIQKNLKSVKPLDAICEYIWNGFDAEATEVRVELHKNGLGLINMVTIVDNGIGINFDELKFKFQPFNDSKKADITSKNNHSLPHGRKGIGRLTFFAFSQTARWDTVYEHEGKKYGYYISMNKDSLNQYDDNGEKQPHEVQERTGTKVTFTQLEDLDKKDIIQKIKEEFFWFLELNKENGYNIFVDNECIDYSDFIIGEENIEALGSKFKHNYDIRLIQWKVKLHITPTKRWTALPPKNCMVCSVEYVPGSAISKYCPICAKKVQREKSNESKRRSRKQKRMVCIELSAKNDRLIWNRGQGEP